MANDVKGLRETRNSLGHRVLWLHYTADPLKDPDTPEGKRWYEAEIQKHYGGRNGLKWRAEMEMDFEAGSGELVFQDFTKREADILVDPFPIDDTYVLFGGMDWGTRNPISFHVYAESPSKTFFSIWEFYSQRVTVSEVSRILRDCPYYDRLQWIACDPTMYSETVAKKDGFTSIAEMMQDEEVVGDATIDKLMPAHGRSDETAINKVKNLWVLEDPKLKIFKTCGNQINELRNLKYPERREYQNETEKILDKNNHAWDDLKYFLLSHPYAAKITERPKFGTVAYITEAADLARIAAEKNGTSVQEEFNDIYGTIL